MIFGFNKSHFPQIIVVKLHTSHSLGYTTIGKPTKLVERKNGSLVKNPSIKPMNNLDF